MTDAVHLYVGRLATPVGELAIVADELGRLRALHWGDQEAQLLRALRLQCAAFALEPADDPAGLTTVMSRYFAGDLAAIQGVPVEAGGTPFQRAVWSALRDIPCGTTESYGALAARIGRPAAVRAVGLANGANPVAIVVPCHRVIGASGALTGYGGGMERKRWLLEHEHARGVRRKPSTISAHPSLFETA